MIRRTQSVLRTSDVSLANDIITYKQNISDLIFKARNKYIQNVQYGELPVEFDYIILNLFTSLERTSEHCLNVTNMLLRRNSDDARFEFVNI